MNTHTPGPWTRVELSRDMNRKVARVREQMVNVGREAVCIEYDAGEEGDANARLIAAAPELLAALKQILVNTTPYESYAGPVLRDEDRQCALDALAKAQGQEA